MTWNPVPGVDKNSKPYEDFVAQVFGPMELFLRTAFITQRPTKNLPDLTDATAGEKKTLFVDMEHVSAEDFSHDIQLAPMWVRKILLSL